MDVFVHLVTHDSGMAHAIALTGIASEQGHVEYESS